MLFNSVQFFAFFAVVYVLYCLLGRTWQNRMLLVASMVFYAAWDWRFLALLLTTITVDYSVGRGLDSLTSPRARRVLLAISLTASLSFLGFFKYFDFFVDSFASLLTGIGIDARGLHLDLVLPVGISFYTFHTISYVVDVYFRRTPACRSFVDFALFVSFFPQLVAGPIARATQLLPQIQRDRRIAPEQIVGGLFLIFVGLIEKVVIADGCSEIVNAVFGHDAEFSGADKLVAIYAFAFQIFGDFAGYTDIARGVAKLMGFELVLNFNLPYFATNPSDFWRRWHISLSTWLRDYLYIPLGGNRRGVLMTYRNLLITMVLGGIWHGAAWTMVLWGAYHGVLLAAHRFLTGDRDRGVERARPALRNALQIVGTFQLVCLGWLIFRASDVAQVGRFVGSIATDPSPSAHTASFALLLLQLAGPLLLYQWWQYRAGTLDVFARWSVQRRTAFVTAAGWLVVAFIALHRSLLHLSTPFIYFQF